MLKDRIDDYKTLEEMRNSKLLVYVTSDRSGLETAIAPDILGIFANHLDTIGDTEKITLVLYTQGGSTLAAWSLVNLIRSFCKDFEVIIPFHCHSAGTLICLGANNIVMTKQASLGPIDPSTNGLMNPQVTLNGQLIRVPVSVEHVNGYLEMAKSDLGINEQGLLKDIFLNLADKIHPLSLGEVYRSKTQIQMLAKKLLKNQQLGEDKEQKIINFLCSGSGSHDYTIFRKEAIDELGLSVEKPDDKLYSIIKSIYRNIEDELELKKRYDPQVILGATNSLNYSFKKRVNREYKRRM